MDVSPGGAAAARINRAACRGTRAQVLLRRFLAEAAAACRASEATLWTISADGAAIEAALNSGSQQRIEDASVPSNDSVVGLVANTGIAACIGPGDYQNPSVAALTGVTVHAMVVAPLRSAGIVCGVLSAVNPSDGGVFSSADLEILQWKAYLLGLLLADACNGGSSA